jgi:hypothetical protein
MLDISEQNEYRNVSAHQIGARIDAKGPEMPRVKTEPPAESGVTIKTRRGKSACNEAGEEQSPVAKRSYLKQTDVPTTSLDDALRLPQAIFDHYAGKPTAPFNVAKALNVDPKGSQLRVLSGAAIAFGLIEGGAQASAITPTELAPKGDQAKGRRRRNRCQKGGGA